MNILKEMHPVECTSSCYFCYSVLCLFIDRLSNAMGRVWKCVLHVWSISNYNDWCKAIVCCEYSGIFICICISYWLRNRHGWRIRHGSVVKMLWILTGNSSLAQRVICPKRIGIGLGLRLGLGFELGLGLGLGLGLASNFRICTTFRTNDPSDKWPVTLLTQWMWVRVPLSWQR